MRHITHMNTSCHTYEVVMSHVRMRHVTRTNESCHIYEWVTSHMWMSHVTHMNESCHSNIALDWLCGLNVGWLRLVGSSKLQVSSAENSLFYRALLQKRPIMLRSLLIVATPYPIACLRHVTRMNESCHTYNWVMSGVRMRHVTYMNASCHTYECDMSGICVSHATHMHESCHIPMSHVSCVNEHVTRMNASCHSYNFVMSGEWMSHVTHINESFHI